MELTVIARKWNWIGHTLKMSSKSIAKQSLKWTPYGHRDGGQLKNMWQENIGEVLSWEK